MASSDNSPPERTGLFASLFSPWVWKMAWRDTRRNRKKLLFFSSSIVLGIAALTAIGSLGKNMERAIEEQARTLLGADLVLASRQPFSKEVQALFKEIGGTQSEETAITSMIYFVSQGSTRLVQVRGLDGDFPFYGTLETQPVDAAAQFRKGTGALVEENLMKQFHAKVGDRIRLGSLTTPIVGMLTKVPGETVAFAAIAPRVYISTAELARTGLLRDTSIARYKMYFKFDAATNVGALVTGIKPRLDELRLGKDTVEDRKRDLGRSMENLYHFLNLVAFVALLLGGVGVASAIHVHVKQKFTTVAILRCLGSSVSQTFAIYLAQAAALGLLGAICGAGLGIAIQGFAPRLLGDFIPFRFEFVTSWQAVGLAVSAGFVFCLFFALLPLLAVRSVSPLAAIRISIEPPRTVRDPLRWLIVLLLGAGVLGFAISQTRSVRVGIGFATGLLAAFLTLSFVAKLLMVAARRIASAPFAFVVRQGLNNLHRPDNRTLTLLLSLGLGTFLMLSLYLAHHSLLDQLISSGSKNQPNSILFDIQPDQRTDVVKLVQALKLPVLDEAPIITMRLTTVKGRSVQSMLSDRTNRVARWALRREYRCTMRDQLRDSEKIIAGQWQPQTSPLTNVIPVSVEDGIAKDLQIGLGDELVFDLQGVALHTRVASLREVDWRRVQPNFFVLFPRGSLEDAPAMHVLVTRVDSTETSARLQREVVKAFPNVSAIDLTLVLQTIDTVLGKINFVVRFMAGFTVATGLLVMAGSLVSGRQQRIQEAILLRTLGASRQQVYRILMVEYASLGFLAALTGILMAIPASWGIARFLLHSAFTIPFVPLAIATIVVPSLTVLIGLLISRGIFSQSPLAVLRSEVNS